ncbi:XrtA/PEP-CTERM system TPR-repeat protein PrsT [Salidesulfovibrio brasiliensis]|uniref:XrtA/PEP-CTERM system TPR-repeat protein PrsT n=1 Tax=Salidesulfovibrio brasiliensis TaxID=221711 RepID=UPI0006D24A0B|nr:XrtA/PEP-CTERM system TPR-repeat protein PrsT [Salidesulfovibrio brasiliensis]
MSNVSRKQALTTAVGLVMALMLVMLPAGCGNSNVTELMSEGQKYLDDGNGKGAIVIFKTVLDKAPENMEARYALGKAYLLSGKVDQAEKNFEKYNRQNPYDKKVLLDLGRLKAVREDFTESIKLLEEYCSEFSDSAEGREALGYAYMGAKRYEDALASFRKAETLDSERASAQVGVVRALAALGRVDESDAALETLLAKWPNHLQGLYLRVARQGASGQLEEYRRTYEQIAESYPNEVYARFMVGKNRLAQRDYDGAQKTVAELRRDFPNLPYGDKLAGMIHFSKHEYLDSIQELHKALTKHREPETLFLLGLAYYGKGDLETAVTQLRNSVDMTPDFVKAREMISLILLRQERLDEAIAEAGRIIDIEPENVVARMTLGDAYTAKGDPENALRQFSTVSEMKPDAPGAFLKIGALQYSYGELEKAENAFREAIAASPNSTRPRIVLASYYLNRDRRDMAEETLLEGISGEKSDVVIYSLLARLALADRDIDKAMGLLQKAKAAAPSDPTPYSMMATVKLALKKPEEALEQYEALLEQQPGNLAGLQGKAAVLEMLGKNDEAEAVHREALKSGVPQAYSGYAAYLVKHDRNEDALGQVRAGKEVNPGDMGLMNLEASVLLRMERYEDVLKICNDMQRQSPALALSWQTHAYMRMGEGDKAVSTAQSMIDLFPKRPAGYLTLYKINAQLGNIEEAVEALKRGEQRCGPDPELFLALGSHYAAEDRQKALNYLGAAIKRDEDYYPAYAAQGSVYQTMGRRNEAIRSYNKALDLNDRYVPALNNLAMLYAEEAKTAPEALRLAYTAYMNAPSNTAVMDTLGYALIVNGKYDEAVQVLTRAAELDGENGSVFYHLGYAYHQRGEDDHAVSALGKSLNSRDTQSVEKARALLAQIRGGQGG